jgi:hypothetical protein
MSSMKRKMNGAAFIALGLMAVVTLTAARGTASGAASGASIGGAFMPALPVPQAPAQGALTQQVGAVKAISGNTLTLTLDSGSEVTVTVQDTTKIVQVAPGQKDLKSATAIQLKDIQTGDRILVRGSASANGKSVAAAGIIAMKHADVEAKQARERDDWQKRGIGGLVSAVDSAAGTITITTGAGPTKKTILVHTTKNTILRRYAPQSVEFNDAKPAPFDQVEPEDQLRARGTKSADGSEFAADEIVSGTFRNISGVLISVDASAKTLSLTDLITKKPVVVNISAQSALRKMPATMAQFIALRLKGAGVGGTSAGPAGATGASGATGGAAAGGAATGGSEAAPNGDARPAGSPGAGGNGGGGQPGGRSTDLQQIVNRLPAATVADFQKGDAVMVVSTQGTDSGSVTAITVLGGIEAILAAAPPGSQGMTLSPWSIGAPAAVSGGGDQ